AEERAREPVHAAEHQRTRDPVGDPSGKGGDEARGEEDRGPCDREGGRRRYEPSGREHVGEGGTQRGRRERAADEPRDRERLAAEPSPPPPQRERDEQHQEERVELGHAPLRDAGPPGVAWSGTLDRAAGGAAHRPLARGHRFLLPSHARLLVVLALAQLGEDARLLALLLEATDRALDGLVVLDPNPCHVVTSPPPDASGTRTITHRSQKASTMR